MRANLEGEFRIYDKSTVCMIVDFQEIGVIEGTLSMIDNTIIISKDTNDYQFMLPSCFEDPELEFNNGILTITEELDQIPEQIKQEAV